jgi:hypothetical protein
MEITLSPFVILALGDRQIADLRSLTAVASLQY